jgi:hypothetical protein
VKAQESYLPSFYIGARYPASHLLPGRRERPTKRQRKGTEECRGTRREFAPVDLR